MELKERFNSGNLSYITETQNGKKLYKFRGVFQEANDVKNNKNRNGRVYTSELWEKVLKNPEFQEKLTSKRMLGELDHPADNGQIRRTSHIVTGVDFDKNTGDVMGELELLNHDQGDAALVRALVDQGVQLCVSSRGHGDFLKDGCTVDPESYKASTWDIVLDPSVKRAEVNAVAEALNESFDEDNKIALLADDKKEEDAPKDKQEKETQSIKENEMDQELKTMMNEVTDLKVSNAKNETKLEEFQRLVDDKNTKISEQAEAVKSLEKKVNEMASEQEEAAELIESQTKEIKELKESKEAVEAKLKEYESIEEEAVTCIEGQKEKISEQDEKITEYEEIGERAADVIENMLEKKEQDDDDDDDDKDKDGDDDEDDEEEDKKEKSKKEKSKKEKSKKEDNKEEDEDKDEATGNEEVLNHLSESLGVPKKEDK